MGFEGLLSKDLGSSGINSARYVKAYKARPHISAAVLEEAGLCAQIGAGGCASVLFDRIAGPRYVAARNVTYELLLSLFDVNSNRMFIARLFRLDKPVQQSIASALRSIPAGRRNVEARLIGMQDNQELDTISALSRLLGTYGIPVCEVDLFGDQTRHIAFDASLGVSFDVLLLDRLYRVGELKNPQTEEQFEFFLKKQQGS